MWANEAGRHCHTLALRCTWKLCLGALSSVFKTESESVDSVASQDSPSRLRVGSKAGLGIAAYDGRFFYF